MIKIARNYIRKRGWVKADDLARICSESIEAKIGNARKARALSKISDKAFEGWMATEDERFRDICNSAMMALNLKPRE